MIALLPPGLPFLSSFPDEVIVLILSAGTLVLVALNYVDEMLLMRLVSATEDPDGEEVEEDILEIDDTTVDEDELLLLEEELS